MSVKVHKITDYSEWIQLHGPTSDAAYGKCRQVSHAMVAAFPELRIAYGNYYCPIWGERWHMWLVAPDGEIIDPTIQQFPSPHGSYVELSEKELPVGRCAQCGKLYYERYDGTVCGASCGIAFLESLQVENLG